MAAGLYPMGVVAEFLGKRPEDIPALVESDELPAIKVPTETRSTLKFSLLGVHGWLKKRSSNIPLTVDEVEIEMDRAAKQLAEKLKAKQERFPGRKKAKGANLQEVPAS